MKIQRCSALGAGSVQHQVMLGALLVAMAAVSEGRAQTDRSRVRRSAAANEDLHAGLPTEQERSLLSGAPANSTERENLRELFRVVNDTKKLEESARNYVYALVGQPQPAADGRGRGVRGQRRKVALEDTIFLKSAPQEAGAKMNISFEGESISDPSIHWTVLYNDTTILVVRSANKYYYWKYAQTISALVIFGFIVVGNLSILYRLKSRRRSRSNVHYFIVQLAIADLLVGIFNVTLDSVLRIQQAFTYGLLACRASKYISSLFIYSSTNLLVALSVDRWEAVVKPLAFTRNRSRGYQLVCGSWLLAVLSALPVAYFSRVKEIDGLPQCWLDLDRIGWRLYLIYLTSLLLVIPTLIIAICYAHIVYTIWSKARLVSEQQRQRHAQRAQRSRDVETGSPDGALGRPETAGERSRKSCLKPRMEASRMCEPGERSDAGQRSQLVKFNKASSRGKALETMANQEQLGGGLRLDQVSPSERRLSAKVATDTSDENNNAHATLTSSTSSTSSRSSSSSSTASGATSRTIPLEAANDLADTRAARTLATISGEPSAIGGEHLDTSLTAAPEPAVNPDAGLGSASREAGRLEPCRPGRCDKQPGRGPPATHEMEPEQGRPSRRTLSEDLSGAKAMGLRTSVSDRRKGCSVAPAKRPRRRRSSHMAGQPNRIERHQQSNSMNSCDSSSIMSKLARKSLKKLAAGKGNNSALSHPGEFEAQQHGTGVIPKARIKTIKMTLVIVIAYILCWTPFLILNLLNVFGIFQNETNFTHAIMTMTQSLAHLNSAVNPIIFWLFSSKRQATDSKPPTTTTTGNGQMGKQTKEALANENARPSSKTARLVAVLRQGWARLRWLRTCCFLSDSASGRGNRAAHSSMFERTTTTTNFSQPSSRYQQQRSGDS